jgi:hypothetical protein
MIQYKTLIINLAHYYLMAATNKRLLISESRSDSKMYTLQGKPDQHATYVFHASPHMSGIRFLWVVLVHGNRSH